ncbi:bifunctional UDP-N-acetylglucosamine diphosphorylase/glucosamine-1-phosphate N-acetyltransferase GlmU [Dongia rigui]|uniref:Bifunctional protein GlmU n=1 Tax=Dongia rigui TaxID=940149 RepID=A0ABU5E1V3_9PROT|nr:bifunctional UDP-N-acetylglucosamine diphosphorylase/glucosamine-1-phosphate N-acetyltransferase GlmU [Dongia rigui]MDY0873474.1 bifunctional UDP-N-acetylglucosamine diphosphorylase/glucosamine-1-phosphate N-acetyltransferase GlmU [Dongia rigui]
MTAKSPSTAAIILAAGKGTRMKSALPKVMHRIAGRTMVGHVLDNLAPLGASPQVVVVAPGMTQVVAEVSPLPTAIQHDQLGTGHAVGCAREALPSFDGTVLVLYGDSPFIATATLKALVARRAGTDNPAVVVLGMRPRDPAKYGRLILDQAGMLERIVEWKDASEDERTVTLCNSGVMAIDGKVLWSLVDRVENKNAKGEYYLTDIVELARRDGRACAVVEAPEAELMGVNSRAELAIAEGLFQDIRRAHAMDEGATLIDPKSVFFAADTKLGRDVIIGPNVVFGAGVEVADDVEIRAFSHIEGARIASGAIIGPFARLRPGTEIGEQAHVGNFVEIKNSVLGEGAKANHLSYLGDADIGAKANIGAGTITCNYDGYVKARTIIGADAFIGSNSALVAPVRVGDGAIVGAGSVITRDVDADAIAVSRAEQVSRSGRARDYRAQRQKLKQDKAARK